MATWAELLARARGGRWTRTWLSQALLALLALGANSALLAQTPPPAPSRSTSTAAVPAQASPGDVRDSTPEVTIEARRRAVDHAVHRFVGKITRSTRFHEQSIALWREPICFAVAGLPRREGTFVLRRLSEIATAAGAPVGGKHCSRSSYNFYVVFSSDVDHDVHYLYDHHGGVFDRNATPVQVHHFLTPSNPSAVRVWHNAAVLGREGFRVERAAFGNGGDPWQYNYQYDGGSRLTAETVTGLNLTLVIIDTTRTNGAKLGQVADYAAMVGLADISVDPDLDDAPTILRLFTEPASAVPNGLTVWDQTFLRATYHTEPSSTNIRTQIADRMVHEVAP